MKITILTRVLLAVVGTLTVHFTFGQSAPVIAYTSPAAYTTNTTITPLTPTTSGGASVNGGFGSSFTLAGGGTPGGTASGAANGTGTAATFYEPYGLALDGKGNLFVADRSNHLIRKIVLSTGNVTTFAGSGLNSYANGTGTAASFYWPTGVAADTTGNIYVADSGNNLIRKITSAGVVSRFTGGGNFLSGGFADGPDGTAIFNRPLGVAVDQSGFVYVTDKSNQRIRKITPAGVVSTLAGSSTGAAAISLPTSDANGSAAVFTNPSGIAIDGSDHLYISNAGIVTLSLSYIQKITISSELVSFLAGGNSASTYADGTGTGASFNLPSGVAVDQKGNIYVADYTNNLIRKITAAGVVTTISGGLGSISAGSANATGNLASYKLPAGIAADDTGNLYIADSGNNLIREIPVAPYSIYPALPGGLTFNTSTGVISGTPIALSPQTTYTISASNGAGSATATLTLSVEQAVPAISYTTPQSYPLNVAITPLTPINTGGLPSSDVVYTLAGGGSSGGTTPGASNATGTAATFTAPYGAVTDGSGTTYVADKGNHLIRRISPLGVVTTLAGTGTSGSADGTGTAASFNAPQGLALDGTGILYVADTGNNKIRKIVTSTGVVTTFSGTGGTGYSNNVPVTYNGPTGLAIYGLYLYIADAGNNKIRKILISTAAVSASVGSNTNIAGSANSTGTNARFSNPTGICADAAGNLYVADKTNNLIRKIVGTAVTTLAGGGTGTATDGTGTAATFNAPSGVAADVYGNLFVTDQGNNLIRKIVTSSGAVTTLAGTTTSGHADGRGTAATFSSPTGIAADVFGNLYVADNTNNLIRRIVAYAITPALPAGLALNETTGVIYGTPKEVSPATTYTLSFGNGAGTGTAMVSIATRSVIIPSITYTTPKTYPINSLITPLSPTIIGGTPTFAAFGSSVTLAGGGSVGGVTTGNTNATGQTATFSAPGGVAVDGSGNTYVADKSNNLIRKISAAGEVTTLAGSGSPGSANGTGTAATFSQPSGVVLDGLGNLYVADAGNNMIRKIAILTAFVSTFAGTGYSGYTNGTALATFNGPTALAIDSIGTVYVADQKNNLIRKINPGGTVTTLAGGGSTGAASGLFNGATLTKFNSPAGIAVDGNGNVYVADKVNNAIRKITPLGVVTTFAGIDSTSAGHADGTGAAATFNGPSGLAIDGKGNLFVTDRGNHTLRKIVLLTAEVTTVAGSNTAGHAEGAGTAATFSNPSGLTFDPGGNLYIADQANNLIRKIPVLPYTITPALPEGLNLSPTTGIISGTPTVRSYAITYTIGTGNSAGLTSTTLSLAVVALPMVNRYGKLTTDNDYVDRYGRIGGASGVNSNGKITP